MLPQLQERQLTKWSMVTSLLLQRILQGRMKSILVRILLSLFLEIDLNVNAEVAGLRAQLAKKEKFISSLQGVIDRLEDQVGQMEERLNETEKELREARRKKEKLGKKPEEKSYECRGCQSLVLILSDSLATKDLMKEIEGLQDRLRGSNFVFCGMNVSHRTREG